MLVKDETHARDSKQRGPPVPAICVPTGLVSEAYSRQRDFGTGRLGVHSEQLPSANLCSERKLVSVKGSKQAWPLLWRQTLSSSKVVLYRNSHEKRLPRAESASPELRPAM